VRIRHSTYFNARSEQFLKVTITNVSSEPIRLVGAGFAVIAADHLPNKLWKILGMYRRRLDEQLDAALKYDELPAELLEDGDTRDETVLLAPTESKDIKVGLEMLKGRLSEQQVAWPYVKDHLTRTWFAQIPVLSGAP
jgi:hypothetical protein